MLRVLVIATATVAILVAMGSVAGGGNLYSAEPKPDKQPLPVYVVAPMDGIFWRAAYPGAEPYVEIGQVVESNAVVAHLEHMRSTRLTAGIKGTVTEFLVADGAWVRAFQPLVKILPEPVKKVSKR